MPPSGASPRLLVEGDWMLDTWLEVESGGFAQEAPVTKWKVRDVHRFAGGAGNVAANLMALSGVEPEMGYTIGLEEIPQKYRLVEDGRVVCRWDIDQTLPEIKSFNTDVDAIVLSDYDKGRFGPPEPPPFCLLGDMLVFCDTRTPKRWLEMVRENWYFFPNTKEYYGDKAAYNEAARRGATIIMTRGSEGASVFAPYKPDVTMLNLESPDPCKDPVSVCGAGDVVVAVVAYLVTKGAGLDFAVAEAMRLAARCVRRPYTCLVQEADLNAD